MIASKRLFRNLGESCLIGLFSCARLLPPVTLSSHCVELGLGFNLWERREFCWRRKTVSS